MIQLSEDQKKQVRQWVTEGARLSEVQRRIREEFKIPITFMEVRFMILDLGLSIKEKEPLSSAGVDLSKSTPAGGNQPGEDFESEAGLGNVTVELDRVVKAGAIVSGSVKFSDGKMATWSLDQMGRLALSGVKEGYRPSQDDLQAFQQELSRLLQNRGF